MHGRACVRGPRHPPGVSLTRALGAVLAGVAFALVGVQAHVLGVLRPRDRSAIVQLDGAGALGALRERARPAPRLDAVLALGHLVRQHRVVALATLVLQALVDVHTHGAVALPAVVARTTVTTRPKVRARRVQRVAVVLVLCAEVSDCGAVFTLPATRLACATLALIHGVRAVTLPRVNQILLLAHAIVLTRCAHTLVNILVARGVVPYCTQQVLALLPRSQNRLGVL